MNNSLYRSEISDVLESLKKVIVDEFNTSDDTTKKIQSDKFLLDASLRVTDEIEGVNDQKYLRAEEQSAQVEELVQQTKGLREPVAGVNENYSGIGPLMEKPLEAKPQAIEVPLAPDPFEKDDDRLDKKNLSLKKSEDVSQAFDTDVLTPIVAEILRKELRGSLGEHITSKIRAMVRREIEVILLEQSSK